MGTDKPVVFKLVDEGENLFAEVTGLEGVLDGSAEKIGPLDAEMPQSDLVVQLNQMFNRQGLTSRVGANRGYVLEQAAP